MLKRVQVPSEGTFVAPTVIGVGGISDLAKEIFGPVMHVTTFKAEEIDEIVDNINASGYGLTFGMHSRIDDRVERVTSRLNAGNIYINRNQIGAVVGSQPFGGEGLSGTGPKAGGPNYVPRFTEFSCDVTYNDKAGEYASADDIQNAIDAAHPVEQISAQTLELPGPTGESNQLSIVGRGTVLCLGPSVEAAMHQVETARANNCRAIAVASGLSSSDGLNARVNPDFLKHMLGVDLVAHWGDEEEQKQIRVALSERAGRIVSLSTGQDLAERCQLERHVCIDTTAAGGNASLLASVSE